MEPGALSQLRRGALEYCVLALLQDEPRYAVDLVTELGRHPSLVTSEGTIYPLLSRLRKEGLVLTEQRESEQGPPRRYYQLTRDGRRALDRFETDWRAFRDAVDQTLRKDTP
ncbi:PadR family transcriptional regulator [Aeromicrobium sp. CFBP 8757]|uniref:PadR family transcriptional regulator n=1 Tax=Aeromicrobium sp. CFBP 8757 TaxID=2775288 RepID=UPI0017824D06|nr:PadR family transcriptional regulator [Aeromicrobium sp. CFBP 8757]MBD8607168.1 PadR family transcriptional regulator [Aeromicrobium sp. CFBP 8757]